jgi:hypothetical protein
VSTCVVARASAPLICSVHARLLTSHFLSDELSQRLTQSSRDMADHLRLRRRRLQVVSDAGETTLSDE